MSELMSGRTRLSGFSDEWKTVSFESLCKTFTKQTGFDYSTSIKRSLITKYAAGFLPFIQNKDFEGKNINYQTDYFVPEKVAIKFPRILLNEKCLLISISGSIGNIAVFSNLQTAFVGGAIAVGKFINKVHLDWVMYYLQSYEGQNKLFGNVKAGSHHNLTLEDIRKFEIPMPLEEEQTAIAKILSDMDAEIAALEGKLSKARQVKAGMMSVLLTGRVRLV
jgi:type I restriction enzyme, S subunit